jgi:leader peptidase (prepilin peptidase) / N-methyltransferase
VIVLAYLASLVAGFAAGVGVNVLADQVEDEETATGRGDHCPACGAKVPAARLLPLMGFSAESRACTKCGRLSSLRAPVLSVTLGLVYLLLLARIVESAGQLRLPVLSVFLIEALSATILAFIFAVDLEHRLILDSAVYPAVVALLLLAGVFDHKAFAAMLIGVIIYGGLFLLLYGLGYLLYRTEALGLGDVKLAILIGLMVGWPGILQAVILGGLFGAAISLVLLGVGAASRHSYIPYGIFMATGAVLALMLTPPYW